MALSGGQGGTAPVKAWLDNRGSWTYFFLKAGVSVNRDVEHWNHEGILLSGGG